MNYPAMRSVYQGIDICRENIGLFEDRYSDIDFTHKRAQGRFYTVKNPFTHPAFLMWAKDANLPSQTILEPFAGRNYLIEHLQHLRLCTDFVSYDITPAHKDVMYRDTLSSFPIGYEVCVTNPPWLAKNSATLRKLTYRGGHYDDLYKCALEKCLTHCRFLAALIPESFIRAHIFRARLHSFISLTADVFADTNHPVGLALFVPYRTKDTEIWVGMKRIGLLKELEKSYPHPHPKSRYIRFNDPKGNLGFFALDNTRHRSIRFCAAEELKDYHVSSTCRAITRISVPWRLNINGYNEFIGSFRDKTYDVLMTPYRGLRSDGQYRRRMDYALARDIIASV